jgi:hypothetical protein
MEASDGVITLLGWFRSRAGLKANFDGPDKLRIAARFSKFEGAFVEGNGIVGPTLSRV